LEQLVDQIGWLKDGVVVQRASIEVTAPAVHAANGAEACSFTVMVCRLFAAARLMARNACAKSTATS
jgi:hypothetical protein